MAEFIDKKVKITSAINDFFAAFSILSPDEKRYFIAAIDKELKKKSKEDKELYLYLIKAAREGKGPEEMIKEFAKG